MQFKYFIRILNNGCILLDKPSVNHSGNSKIKVYRPIVKFNDNLFYWIFDGSWISAA